MATAKKTAPTKVAAKKVATKNVATKKTNKNKDVKPAAPPMDWQTNR